MMESQEDRFVKAEEPRLLPNPSPLQQKIDEALSRGRQERPEAFVAVVSDDTRWLLPLIDVQETAVLPEVAHIGMVKPWVVGIANFRGHVRTVLDMRMLLSNQRTPPSSDGCTVLLHQRYPTHWALVWPQLVGIVRQDYYRQVALPREAESAPWGAWVRQAWSDPEGCLWYEMNVGAFVDTDDLNSALQLF